jgi:hypothetical protein
MVSLFRGTLNSFSQKLGLQHTDQREEAERRQTCSPEQFYDAVSSHPSSSDPVEPMDTSSDPESEPTFDNGPSSQAGVINEHFERESATTLLN